MSEELGPRRLAARRSLRVAVLLAVDMAALFAAGALAYLAWARPVRHQDASTYLELTPLLLLFVLGFAQAGLYPGFGLGAAERLRRIVYATTFLFLVLGSYSFVLKAPHLYSRVTFALALALALLLVPLGRALVARLCGDAVWWPEPVVLGGSAAPAEILSALRGAADLHVRPVAVLAADGGGGGGGGETAVDGVPVRRGEDWARRLAADGVRVALWAGEVDGERLDELQRHFRHVIVLRGYDNLPVEGLQVRTFGSLVGIEATNRLLHPRNRAVKRAVDVALSAPGLLLALPVIALSMAAVRIASPGPATFVQVRIGLGGRSIRVRKVRTMRVDAEAELAATLEANPELAREWRERQKLSRDPRLIPGVGRLLRRFSLDELPQLWSVLRGEMSLVGPRPFPRYHLDLFPERFRELRQRVRPGITGLWQIGPRSEGGIAEQQAADSYYIRNWSLWLDLYVLGRTLFAVLRGRGAY